MHFLINSHFSSIFDKLLIVERCEWSKVRKKNEEDEGLILDE